jgi:hypothetical protein
VKYSTTRALSQPRTNDGSATFIEHRRDGERSKQT